MVASSCTGRRLAITLILAALLPAAGAAQRATGPGPQAAALTRPNWLQRKISDVAWRAMPAADRAVFLARWSEYDRLYAKPDSLARPQGFTVAPSALAYGEGEPSRLFNFYLRYIFIAGTVTQGEGSALLGIYENPIARNIWVVDSGPATFKDVQGEMYFERPRSASELVPGLPAGAIVFDGPLQFDSKNPANENLLQVLLTANGEAPWSDVPRERVHKVLIAEARKQFDEVMKLYADPAYRKMVESIERGKPDRDIASLRSQLTRLENDLAALSAAERTAPAWVQLTSVGTYLFAAPNTPGFQHLVADKPDYYRATGTRTSLRAMLIKFRLTNAYYPAMDRAIEDSYRAFDWAAAMRLMTK